MLKYFCIVCMLLCFHANLFSQNKEGFRFINPNQRSLKIKFKLINNLIIIPVQLNGVKLSFLLDTGVDKTLLLALDTQDSITLENTQKVNIRGLGVDDNFAAYRSVDNTMQIEDVIHTDIEVYFIIDQNNELTKGLGIPVNGIIGYEFFKNFIVRINYKTKTIKLYNPDKFNRKLKRYEVQSLQFYMNKPYTNFKAYDETLTKKKLNLLIDTGNGSSFWFIENDDINLPKLYFEDVLGYGFNSIIEGKRAKVKQVDFGKYKFKNPTVAYPDVEQILQVEKNLKRDGTVGAEVLRRFKLFFDYPNKRLYFIANNDLRDSFNYDMSGLVFEFDGVKIVEEYKRVSINNKTTTSSFNRNSPSTLIITVGVKPQLKVKSVRKYSPASDAGILPGDELLKINGKNAYSLELEEIQTILAEKEGKKVKLEFLRNGETIKIDIYLRDRFEDILNNYKN